MCLLAIEKAHLIKAWGEIFPTECSALWDFYVGLSDAVPLFLCALSLDGDTEVHIVSNFAR